MAYALAVDAAGNAYVAGGTWSTEATFPVALGPDLTFNSYYSGPDAFVAKVDPLGTALVYCGFVGGSRGDLGSAIAVDASGSAYIGGWTFSEDFPVLLGPGLSPHGTIAQNADGFVAKVNPLGTGLLYSGFVGGTSGDQVLGLAIDGSGNAYLAGWTESSDFPTGVQYPVTSDKPRVRVVRTSSACP